MSQFEELISLLTQLYLHPLGGDRARAATSKYLRFADGVQHFPPKGKVTNALSSSLYFSQFLHKTGLHLGSHFLHEAYIFYAQIPWDPILADHLPSRLTSRVVAMGRGSARAPAQKSG